MLLPPEGGAWSSTRAAVAATAPARVPLLEQSSCRLRMRSTKIQAVYSSTGSGVQSGSVEQESENGGTARGMLCELKGLKVTWVC